MEKQNISHDVFEEGIKCDKAVAALEAITFQYQAFSDLKEVEDFFRLINYVDIALDYAKEMKNNLNKIELKVAKLERGQVA